jgi:hypothetical protein
LRSHKQRYELASLDTAAVLGTDPDPHVYGPPGSGFITHRYGSESGSGSFPFLGNKNLVLKIMCLRVSYKKKNMEKNNIFAFLKTMKEGFGSEGWIRIH